MGLFGRFKERCKICLKEFKVEEEYKQHIETLHPLEKPCTKCDGLMVIANIRLGASVYGCTKCGFIELYMTDPKGEFYRD